MDVLWVDKVKEEFVGLPKNDKTLLRILQRMTEIKCSNYISDEPTQDMKDAISLLCYYADQYTIKI